MLKLIARKRGWVLAGTIIGGAGLVLFGLRLLNIDWNTLGEVLWTEKAAGWAQFVGTMLAIVFTTQVATRESRKAAEEKRAKARVATLRYVGRHGHQFAILKHQAVQALAAVRQTTQSGNKLSFTITRLMSEEELADAIPDEDSAIDIAIVNAANEVVVSRRSFEWYVEPVCDTSDTPGVRICTGVTPERYASILENITALENTADWMDSLLTSIWKARNQHS